MTGVHARLAMAALGVALLAGALVVRTHVAAQPPAHIGPVAVHTSSAQNASGPPKCPTTTATGCDRSGVSNTPCTGHGPGLITASPIGFSDIAYIIPMGTMIGGHVTPIDHGYFYVKGAFENPSRQVAVRSPMTGIITNAGRTVRTGPNGAYDDYALTIESSCSFRVRFSNMVRFDGAFGAAVGALAGNTQVTPKYKVSAGELIGYTGLPTAFGIDVWVENDDVTLSGFIHPDQYTQAEAWKTHVVDLFDYTQELLRERLLALDLREAMPRWGKIDDDVPAHLVGSWFRVGSGGYAGGDRLHDGYWVGHMAVAYDGIDPTAVELSFGDFAGQARQFTVVGNSPDPATVTQASGLIKYELANSYYYSAATGQDWDTKHYTPGLRAGARPLVEGTVLLQLVGPETLKVEIFPGKTAGQVSGFDDSALMYVR